MSNKLKEFYNDKAMQEAWAEFIIDTMNEEALRRVYAGEDTQYIKEANDLIKRSFAKLRDMFEPKKEKKVVNRAL